MRNRMLLVFGCVGGSLIFACFLVAGGWLIWQGRTGNGLLEMLATPTTGSITGMVLDDNGNPLVNIYDEETLIVALFCSSNDSDIECLHEEFWDMDIEVLFDSICEADDTASNCLLHLGQGAASVEADGSYTIADVPPGQYGLVFMLSVPGMKQISNNSDIEPVQAGEITEYDIATELQRR